MPVAMREQLPRMAKLWSQVQELAQQESCQSSSGLEEVADTSYSEKKGVSKKTQTLTLLKPVQ